MTAKKLAAAEERLFDLLDQYRAKRLACRDGGFQDRDLAQRAEALFDAAEKERKTAQALFDNLTEMHADHWRREYERQMAFAREAIVPLVRAWRIAYRAQGAVGHFPPWVSGQFSGALVAEIIDRTDGDKHEIPLDPPKSFALDRADDELRTN